MRSDCRTRVVWAAFRERNFEVGEPFLRARSVPSTVVKISHIRKRETHFFNKKSYFISFSSPYPFSSPFVCHLLATYLHRNLIGISSEPHRNLTGTSSESHRMMSVSSSSYQRYLNSSLFIIFPLRSTVSRLAYPDSPTP